MPISPTRVEDAVQRRSFLAGAAGLAAGVPVSAPGRAAARTGASDPATYARTTTRLREQYWTHEPARLLPKVARHVRVGAGLLAHRPDTRVAAAVAESALLVSRIAFFDLQLGSERVEPWQDLALAAADTAGDGSLGAAVLGHMVFAPAWSGRGAEARGRLDAARARARRGGAGPVVHAWLDAVASEAEVRLGNPSGAFRLLDRAAATLAPVPSDGPAHGTPAWLDWFSGPRLDGFRGAAELAAGRADQARASLNRTLAGLSPEADKQRAVTVADLAAAAASAREPEDACGLLHDVLDLVERQGYATAVDRVRTVRATLAPWSGERCVTELDDRLASGAGRAAPPHEGAEPPHLPDPAA
ncbi:transcriptional regulator [Yinghuangia sp. ASG 101]|uniref:transcriptional regulator n=1 Tax=Yinghuangia sp. ASG 101 TaxID=2896848 RepID=UPI001E573A0F|nr:transcriptional regulator [Yinghuangia sp. ASG 101]UGQ09710.1 transcriptional regulator [Yinghuangia sp. ASG 101]